MFQGLGRSCALPRRLHTWGKDQHRSAGIRSSLHAQPCTICGTVRFIRYTRGGNRVIGYELPPREPVVGTATLTVEARLAP
jgi:hypothetical protein